MHPPSERFFDCRVIQPVKLIPCHRLATNGHIADLIGAFGSARQVGWVLRRQRLHRNDPHALNIAEGIPVDAEGRLPLKQYLWRPNF